MVHKSFAKNIFCISGLFVTMILSSCSTYKNSNEGIETEQYVPCSQILDDIDQAYNTNYTKFTLPDKSMLHITQPLGVYELELEAINRADDKEWEKQKSLEIKKVFEVPPGTSEDVIDACAVVSGAYYINENRIPNSLTSLNPSADYETDIVTVSPSSIPLFDEKAKETISKSENYAHKAKEVFDDNLDTKVYDVYVNNNGTQKSYGVEMQKSYKGVGLLHMHPLHHTPDQLKENNHLHILQTYSDFDDNADIVFYAAPPSYKAIKTDELEKVLSFKGACDILENELAPNSAYVFDDVVLMYEPYMDETKGDLANLNCYAKWFFIMYSEQSGQHMIQYFSVDCKDGTVTAVL